MPDAHDEHEKQVISDRVHHPNEGRTLSCSQRLPKATDVYWAALVAVMDHALGLALQSRHLQRIEHELGVSSAPDCSKPRAEACRNRAWNVSTRS
jgi:hypothetical protein